MKDSKALEVWNKILNMDIGSPNSMYTYELKNKITKEDRDIIEQALQPTNIDNELVKFIKNFIPLDEPYCSACMYYTESDCSQQIDGKCYLNNLKSSLKALTTPSKSAKEITDKEYELILEYRKILKLQDIRDNNYVSTAIQKLKELEEK